MKRLMHLVRAVLIAVVVAVAMCGLGQAKPVVSATPDVAATSFYTWYLHELAANRDPMSDDRQQMESYVSQSLLREIKRRLASPDGMDADYFLKAQDYLNDWVDHVQTAGTRSKAGHASTVVVLGDSQKSPYRLTVMLVDEAGVWKISGVKRNRVVAKEALPHK